ncbi:MAG: 16S rRNA (guanine(966)-N(2))-methyltransferase RsmD, partial [Phycisphaerae bacterium]|nr:16S rRNA (guanine(966)-N(2))-methyltransferase RsmD [Phycisphaerae bacterium]
MRVISGRLRGQRVEAPPGLTTRPITDRVKESLFNILGARYGMPGRLPEIDVLDIFAGSGALGIEALSRGARGCVFVERDRHSLAVLRGNITRLRLGDECRVVAENAWTLRVPPARGDGYGLIFVDPPFRDVEDTLRVVDLLDRLGPRVSADGVVVLRHDVRTRFEPNGLLELHAVDDRRMGRNRLLLLARGTGGD